MVRRGWCAFDTRMRPLSCKISRVVNAHLIHIILWIFKWEIDIGEFLATRFILTLRPSFVVELVITRSWFDVTEFDGETFTRADQTKCEKNADARKSELLVEIFQELSSRGRVYDAQLKYAAIRGWLHPGVDRWPCTGSEKHEVDLYGPQFF